MPPKRFNLRHQDAIETKNADQTVLPQDMTLRDPRQTLLRAISTNLQNIKTELESDPVFPSFQKRALLTTPSISESDTSERTLRYADDGSLQPQTPTPVRISTTFQVTLNVVSPNV